MMEQYQKLGGLSHCTSLYQFLDCFQTVCTLAAARVFCGMLLTINKALKVRNTCSTFLSCPIDLLENLRWAQIPGSPHSGETCPQVTFKKLSLFSHQGSLTLSSVNILFVFLLLFLFALGKVH